MSITKSWSCSFYSDTPDLKWSMLVVVFQKTLKSFSVYVNSNARFEHVVVITCIYSSITIYSKSLLIFALTVSFCRYRSFNCKHISKYIYVYYIHDSNKIHSLSTITMEYVNTKNKNFVVYVCLLNTFFGNISKYCVMCFDDVIVYRCPACGLVFCSNNSPRISTDITKIFLSAGMALWHVA